MQWNPRQAALHAAQECVLCQGFGVRSGPSLTLCDCVYRTIFRACLVKFRQCVKADAYTRLVTFERTPRGVDRSLIWRRRNEDYCADFQAAGRRVLPPRLYRVFSFYHLLGGSAELVLRRLRISRRTLTDWIAEVELSLGRELAHMQPYSLFPPREYMSPSTRGSASENASSVA